MAPGELLGDARDLTSTSVTEVGLAKLGDLREAPALRHLTLFLGPIPVRAVALPTRWGWVGAGWALDLSSHLAGCWRPSLAPRHAGLGKWSAARAGP